jgi:hypothetical protein
MDGEIGKKTGAWMPVLMSLGAIVLLGIRVVTHGLKPVNGEGALVQLWQLLLLAQLPLIIFFGHQWLRRAPRQSLTILAVQGLALATAALPVFVLGW